MPAESDNKLLEHILEEMRSLRKDLKDSAEADNLWKYEMALEVKGLMEWRGVETEARASRHSIGIALIGVFTTLGIIAFGGIINNALRLASLEQSQSQIKK
jgi:hypothetical protein